MPRSPRVVVPGALHHVTARAPKGLVLFRADADRRRYLDLLAAEVESREWSLRTYCLMSNHIHLLVLTPGPDLSAGMKRAHERFAGFLHRRYEGHGHVFGDRFHNRLVLTDDHCFACLRYIARNPVAAGLCPTADDWSWSAHRALAGHVRPPRYLDAAATHDLLGATGYRSMVGTSDAQLMDDLARTHPNDWLVRAANDHRIPIPAIAAHLGVGKSTVYSRLAAARDAAGKKGQSPDSSQLE